MNDFLSGKRSYASKPGRAEKVDMGVRAKELVKKARGKKSKRRKKRLRKIER